MTAGTRAAAARLALLAVMVALPPLGLHQHVAAVERHQWALLRDAMRHHAGLAAQALAPVLDQPMASSLIEAPSAVAALAGDRLAITLLFRPHGAAAWYHVASSGDGPIDVGALLPTLAGGCGAAQPLDLDIAAADGRTRPAALTPAAGRDGCWLVVFATEGPLAHRFTDTPRMRPMLAAYALMAAILGAMLCPPTWSRRGDDEDKLPDARINLSAMVRELVHAFTASHGQRLTVGAVVADGVWVRAAADRLKDAITGLFRTAVEATPAGGFVGIRLEGADGVCILTVEHEGPAASLGDLSRIIAGLGGKMRTEPAEDHGRVVVVLPQDRAAHQ